MAQGQAFRLIKNRHNGNQQKIHAEYSATNYNFVPLLFNFK